MSLENQWLEWKGGECPIRNDIKVDYVVRIGIRMQTYAGFLRWTHDEKYKSSDIIKYKVIKEIDN